MITDAAIDLGAGIGLLKLTGIAINLLGPSLLIGLAVGVGFALLGHFIIDPLVKDLKNFVGKTVNQLEKEVNKFFKLLKKLFS